MLTFLSITAKFLSLIPEGLLGIVCRALGGLFFIGSKRRRRIILSNLKHAFPEESLDDLQWIGKTSCARMIEMSLLSFCAGQFSEARIRKSLIVNDSINEFFRSRMDSKKPVIYLVPHFTLMEMQPWLKTIISSEKDHEIICIYRSLNQNTLETHIKNSRERHGTRFRSRKEGFVECMQCLRRGGQVSILFDQNARKSGALVYFMGRLCAATDLPGILAKKFEAEIRAIWVERTAFWRGELKVETLPDDWADSPEKLTAGSQVWLEEQFKKAPKTIPDWLWSHNRWRTESSPDSRFSLQNKKVWLQRSVEMAGLRAMPRKTYVLMNLPKSPELAKSLIPVLSAIRSARPDMALWMMAESPILSLDSLELLADREIRLDGTKSRSAIIADLKHEYLDTICDWDLSSPFSELWPDSDCPQIFGWIPQSGHSHGYTHTVKRPSGEMTPLTFQAACFSFAAHFGLEISKDS
ncbi:MAG: hypothetical protein AAGB06_06790 [Verrucomicrobiota bacterium]